MAFYEPFIVSMYMGMNIGYQNVLENIKHSMQHFSAKTIFFPCSITRRFIHIFLKFFLLILETTDKSSLALNFTF